MKILYWLLLILGVVIFGCLFLSVPILGYLLYYGEITTKLFVLYSISYLWLVTSVDGVQRSFRINKLKRRIDDIYFLEKTIKKLKGIE